MAYSWLTFNRVHGGISHKIDLFEWEIVNYVLERVWKQAVATYYIQNLLWEPREPWKNKFSQSSRCPGRDPNSRLLDACYPLALRPRRSVQREGDMNERSRMEWREEERKKVRKTDRKKETERGNMSNSSSDLSVSSKGNDNQCWLLETSRLPPRLRDGLPQVKTDLNLVTWQTGR
jgi:hypothetical protein